MSFYAQFAEAYEAVFPLREVVFSFLHSLAPAVGGRILDLGCGPGHYCGRFAAAGHTAVGIDADREMIAAAERRYGAVSRFHRVRLQEITVPAEAPFDLVFCIGNVLAHVPPQDLAGFAADLPAVLRPGGIWTFQVVNWETILTQPTYRFPPKPVTVAGEGEPTLQFERAYEELSAERARFVTRLVSPRGTLFEGSVWLYPVRADAYMALFERSGFVLEGHYADFARTPFESASAGADVMVFRRRD